MSDKTFNIIQKVLFVILIIILLFSIFKVAGIIKEYKSGRDAYQALENYVEIKEPTVVDTKPVEESEVASTEDEEIVVNFHDNFVDAAVDATSLKGINDDFRGWLYAPALNINYPVVYSNDNSYYLTHTFQGEENKSGALFLDMATDEAFKDYNTVIHGHNMKDGSMFGRLKMFYNDTKRYASDPYFYIYTEEADYKYLVFSYYVTTTASDAYNLPQTQEEWSNYVSYAKRMATYKIDEPLPEYAPIVTLSTCHGSNYTDKRMVVHGILVETREN